MPAIPGEVLLTTLFADVHYFFRDPSSRPQHHRFNRGSYVYIYHNPTDRQAKLEIANNPATAEQDAVAGYFDSAAATVQYSYKQPTLVTVNVARASAQDQAQWHLPGFNERNDQRALYKIHSLDIYLWTEKDAAIFLGHLKAVLPLDRVDIRDAPSSVAPTAEHRDSMSPVVQLLEKTAIGRQFPPRAESTTSSHSFGGPPTPATGATASPPPPPAAASAPMAYNPAAPAAPEPIAYREKTPPPPDGASGPGLAAAAKYDVIPQYASGPPGYNSNQPTPHQAYFSGPPPSAGFPGSPQRTHSGNLPPPPPGGPSPHNHTPQPTSPPPHQQNFQRQSSFGGPPQTQYASYPQHAAYNPAVNSPGLPPTPGYGPQPPTPSAPPAYVPNPLQSPGLPPPPPSQPPAQAHQHQQWSSVGGYSTYNYSATQPAAQSSNPYGGGYTGDMHGQVYRPTEAEASHGHHSAPKPSSAETKSNGRVRLENRVAGTEKKVGEFFKRLDRLI